MAIKDWLLVIVLGTIWGSSFMFNAVLIEELGPLWVSAGRVGIGALGCWAFLFATGRTRHLPGDRVLYVHFFILGTLSYTVPFSLFPLSQQSLAAGVAAIINAMTPIMTVIVSHFWKGGEKASVSKSLGVVAGFAGVFVLASPALSAGGTSQLWAIGACLAATTCYAVALNYTRNFSHVNPSALAACALTGATVSATPAAYLVHGTPQLTSVAGWAALLGIGLIATALAFQIAYRILPRIGATNFSVVTFIAPVSAIVLSVSLLGEVILPSHILGMLGIFVGLLLIDGRIARRFRKKPVTPDVL